MDFAVELDLDRLGPALGGPAFHPCERTSCAARAGSSAQRRAPEPVRAARRPRGGAQGRAVAGAGRGARFPTPRQATFTNREGPDDGWTFARVQALVGRRARSRPSPRSQRRGGRAQLSHPRGGWRALDHAPQRREVPVPPRPCASPPVGLSPRWGV
jgi:hypothetical protein